MAVLVAGIAIMVSLPGDGRGSDEEKLESAPPDTKEKKTAGSKVEEAPTKEITNSIGMKLSLIPAGKFS